MADIKDLTLKEAREKLGAKQAELGKVFAEAKTDAGEYDFKRVKCLGDQVKGSAAVADQVKAMNTELNELAKHAETLEAAEKAAGDHAEREKGRGRLPFAPAGGARDFSAQIKSLGELATGTKDYQDFARRGDKGGITLSFEDAWPTDVLGKSTGFDTLGSKALLARTAGYAPESIRAPGFVEAITRPIQLLDIIPTGRTGQAAYKYMEETTRTHAAAERAEAAAFAESTFLFTERSVPVEKITDSVPVTDEQLEDVEMMSGYINGRLTFGIRQRLDLQVIAGDGAAPNLRGLKNVSGIQTHAKGADPVPDAFYKAMTKIRLVGRATPTHHVMHPNDWQRIRLLRTPDGVYIWGSPSQDVVERLWGLPVVQQDADVEGRGYTGSFMPMYCTLFERRGVDIQVGYVGNQFLQGMRTVRGDMRAVMVWLRPAAFCEVTGVNV